MAWVTLDELKDDLGITDERDDSTLRRRLAAAVAYVEDHRSELFYDDDGARLATPTVPDTVILGTLMLAGRLQVRRRSPYGLVAMADLGVARIGRVDPDIEAMLSIPPTVA